MDIRIIPPGEPSSSELNGLAELLLDAVADGASIGFLASLTADQARDWWQRTLRDPVPLTWVATDGDRIVGTVRLIPVSYPNGTHRADVSKFLVLREARGRGYGRALMDAVEATAITMGRRLLMLDTETGSHAEFVYERWGWQRYGIVPGHAATPDGKLAPTTFMYKQL